MAPRSASAFAGRPAAGATRSPVEVVLESSSVAHAQEIEARTLREVEEKAAELRLLVGGSYRSLIASADTILSMRGVADQVVGSLGRVRGQLAALASQGADSGVALDADAVPRAAQAARGDDFATGCRVKFLLDTPELLWGLLEEGAFGAAADRLLGAHDVYEALQAASGARQAARAQFPVLEAAWPAVALFRGSIGKQGREALRRENLTSQACSDAVLGVALADSLPSAAALGELLDARRGALREKLAALPAGSDAPPPGSPSALQQTISAFVAAVTAAQQALCQAGEVFLDVPGAPPLLLRSLSELHPVAQLTRGLPQAERECSAWNERRARDKASLPALPPPALAAAVRAWLAAAMEDVSEAAPRLLAACTSLSQLAEVEANVRAAVRDAAPAAAAAEWAVRCAAASAAAAAAAAGPASRWSVLDSSASDLAAEEGAVDPLSSPQQAWRAACALVLGRASPPLCVWTALCASAFQQRTHQLLRSGVASLPWDADAATLVAHPPPPPPPEAQWSLPEEAPLSAYGTPRFGAEQAAVEALDTALRRLREDCAASLRLAGAEADEPGAAARTTATAEEARAAAAAAAQASVAALGKAVDAAATGSEAAARLLLVARLASALAERSSELPLWLGPSAGWRAGPEPSAPHDGAVSRPRGSAADRARLRRAQLGVSGGFTRTGVVDASSPHAELSASARSLAARAHSAWAKLTAEGLVAPLRAALAEDVTLTSSGASPPPKGWEELVLSNSDDQAAPAAGEASASAEVKIFLPAQPSPHLSALLFAAGVALSSAGPGPSPPISAVRALAHELGLATLAALSRRESATGASALSERGRLQMLFDVRFAADVLAAGSPEASAAAAAGSAGARALAAVTLNPWKAAAGALLERLSEQLDPIDWATFEPPLWTAVRRCYARSGVLLGTLISAQPLHAGAAGRLAPGGDGAAASLPPPRPRFAYLPVAPAPPAPSSLAARGLAAAAGTKTEAAAGAEEGSALLKAFSAGRLSVTSFLGEAAGGRLAGAVAGLQGVLQGGQS